MLKAGGAEVKRNTPASPNFRAYIERAIQTLQVERLDKFEVVAERHLNKLQIPLLHLANQTHLQPETRVPGNYGHSVAW